MVEKIRESYLEALKNRNVNFGLSLESVPIQSLHATKDSINNIEFERVLKLIKNNVNIPILVQECYNLGKERTIIDGHARALACRKLGKRKIDAWVICCKDDPALRENLGRLRFKKIYQISIK